MYSSTPLGMNLGLVIPSVSHAADTEGSMRFLNSAVLPFLDYLTGFVAEHPVIRALQALLLICAFLLVFLVFWVTRDIANRSHSLIYQLMSIVIVSALPFVGFFLYLLIRPRKTFEEVEVVEGIRELKLLLRDLEEGKRGMNGEAFPSLKNDPVMSTL